MEKRRNYPVGERQAQTLARRTLDLSDDTEKNITRFSVLNALLELLGEDPAVYKKVLKKVK